jgi:hypothetical protein
MGISAGFLAVLGITAAMAGSGSPADSTKATGTSHSQSLQSEAQAFTAPTTQPEATDPEDSSQSSIESKGVTNQSDHSVNITSDNSGTTVTVNGQTSTVPANGSMDQTYSTDGSSPSTTHISIDNNSSQSAAGNSISSHVSVRSSTRTEGRSGRIDTDQ